MLSLVAPSNSSELAPEKGSTSLFTVKASVAASPTVTLPLKVALPVTPRVEPRVVAPVMLAVPTTSKVLFGIEEPIPTFPL